MNVLPFEDQRLNFDGLSDDEVVQLLKQHGIGLTVEEARTIQSDILSRAPTLSECLLWSIQGSEHCSYKSSKHWLSKLPTVSNHFLLGIGEDAAVVSVATDDQGYRYGIAISHESHNHPSQIVPFEGAATGVGGNVRDISCMGAEVVAIAECLRFGSLDSAQTHWLHHGVVDGIASYGNALGIPNIAGNAYYHPSYQSNCLVTVVSLGVVREDEIIHSYVPDNADGYALILVGKPTDNSGFGGASFASADLETEEENRGAVQEPNAFLERHLLKANGALFKKLKAQGLLPQVAFKDLGAGGIACASVELADGNGFGCIVDLDNVHLGMKHLHPSVILCSETQERFMWAVPQDLVDVILEHYNTEFDLPNVSCGAQASVIGKITDDSQYIVSYKGKCLVDAPASAVTKGLTVERIFQAYQQTESLPRLSYSDHNQLLKSLLALPEIADQKPIYRHYDKQVQGRTILERGQAAAGMIAPFNDQSFPVEIQSIGVALAVGHNPRHNLVDSYYGAQKTIANVIEKIISVGASPLAITDCLCFGNPEHPEHMYDFVRAVEGIKIACENYLLPDSSKQYLAVAGGNVSFYNSDGDQRIPPSPIISCLGRVTNHKQAITPNLKHPGNKLLIIRGQELSLSGSCLYALENCIGTDYPTIDFKYLSDQTRVLLDCMTKDLISACAPIEEGGLVSCLAKMAILGNHGVNIRQLDHNDIVLGMYAESGGFIIEVSSNDSHRLMHLFTEHHLNITEVGQVTEDNQFKFLDIINQPVSELSQIWQHSFGEHLS